VVPDRTRFTKSGQEPQCERDLTECERGGISSLTQFEQDSAMKSSTAADDLKQLQVDYAKFRHVPL